MRKGDGTELRNPGFGTVDSLWARGTMPCCAVLGFVQAVQEDKARIKLRGISHQQGPNQSTKPHARSKEQL